jgi:hypothetical protein
MSKRRVRLGEFLEPDDERIGNKVQISLSDMDLPRWKQELEADKAIIEGLLAEMRKITPSDDAKLQHLKTTILSKLASPINAGNKKVLLFTAFADTADYLYDQLAPFFLEKEQLHTARVTGADSPKSTLPKRYDYQSLLTSSPRAQRSRYLPNEKPRPSDRHRLHLEGQNLQDCDCVINYDIHWNPVRIIQRFGESIVSVRKQIHPTVNYWRPLRWIQYINLKEAR